MNSGIMNSICYLYAFNQLSMYQYKFSYYSMLKRDWVWTKSKEPLFAFCWKLFPVPIILLRIGFALLIDSVAERVQQLKHRF